VLAVLGKDDFLMTRNDLLAHDGVTQPITEWALDYGITPELILSRLSRGMRVGLAITKPMKTKPGDRLPDPCSPGVVSNLRASEGTGAGSAAQDRPEIDFSQDAQ
jgi:hypothetical protein